MPEINGREVPQEQLDKMIKRMQEREKFEGQFGKAGEDRDRLLHDEGFGQSEIEQFNTGKLPSDFPATFKKKVEPVVLGQEIADTVVPQPTTKAEKFDDPLARGDVSQAFQSHIKRKADLLNSQVEASFEVDANQAARAIKLKAETGLPTGLVAENMDGIEKELLKGKIVPERFIKENPIVTDWLLDHEFHAGMSREEVLNLGHLETLLKRPKRLWPLPEKNLLEMAQRSADRRTKLFAQGIVVADASEEASDKLDDQLDVLDETSPGLGLLFRLSDAAVSPEGFDQDRKDRLVQEKSPIFLQEEIDKLREQEAFISQFGEVGSLETVSRRFDENPVFMIPFLSAAPDISRLGELLTASFAVRDGKANASQQDLLFQYSRMTEVAARRGQDTLGMAAGIIAETPSLVGEFVFTGGVYTGVKGLTLKGGKEVVEGLIRNSISKVLRSRVSSSIAGAAAQTLVNPQRFVKNALVEMQPHGAILQRNDGSFEFKIAPGTGKSFTAVMPAALFRSFAEMSSERVGGAKIFKMLDSGLNKVVFD